MPTFDKAVDKVYNLEYSLEHMPKRTKIEVPVAESVENPIILHIDEYSYSDVLKEIERLRKTSATLYYDEILMHPEKAPGRRKKVFTAKPEKKIIKRLAERIERRGLGKKIRKPEKETADSNILIALSEAKKRRAMDRITGRVRSTIEEVNLLGDLQLIAYGRDNMKELYKKLKSGKVSLKTFRKKVREKIAMDYGVPEDVAVRYVSDTPNPFLEIEERIKKREE